MELWQEMVRDSVHTVDHVVEKFGIDRKAAEDLDEFFQARINPYYLSLIRYPGDPIWLQCVPAKVELEDIDAEEDPLHEDEMSPFRTSLIAIPIVHYFLLQASAVSIAVSAQGKEKLETMKRSQ